MTITVEIPDLLVGVLSSEGKDPARVVLEAMALDGYRTQQLTETDLKELLGLETRMEVHAFLKYHGVFMHYTVEDLDHDVSTALDATRRYQMRKDGLPPNQPAG
jgi:hypothetical protein